MIKTPPLPDDVELLKKLLLQQQARNNQLETQVLTLQEQLNLALARRYAASSEKITIDQLRLFDEAEVDANDVSLAERESGITTVTEHSRQKKTGRQKLPENLPRIDVIHELNDADCICDHDGNLLIEIAEVVSEQLDIVPAKIQVIRHIRKKYACSCGQCIKTAPLPNQPIPKSIASPGLLAHVNISKYQDGLPLYRQETIVQRIGVELSRATMANWMIQCGNLIQPLINLSRDSLLAGGIIFMDETTVQVLNEPDKKIQSKSYLWVQRGGPPDKPVILFDYDPGRSQTVPQCLLEGYHGALQTDGYAGYNAVVNQNGLIHLGCFAHARRKFTEVIKAQGKNKNKNKKTGKAQRALNFIQKLYKIEKSVKCASVDERFKTRQTLAIPILNQCRTWLDEVLPLVPPKTTLGKALIYLNNEWPKLIRYVDDGRYRIDNNLAENAIRPFVVGRKNWLFSQSIKGVKASANLYSLIETAKANGLEPYAYLKFIFTHLPRATSVEKIEALLPWCVNANMIKIY